jgi:endoglucanase
MAALATGFNLPGVCDVPPEQARLPGRRLLSYLAKRGFRSVRLPIDPELCAKGIGDFSKSLDAAAKAILGAGLSLSLELHPGAAVGALLRSDPAKGGELIAAAWHRLAAEASRLPSSRVALELLNEPPLAAADWRGLRQNLVDEIRKAAPNHTLIWSAAQNQTIEETVADSGPSDTNAIAAVHYYYPMIFTHQGQTWDRSPYEAIHQLPFPFVADDPRVVAIATHLRATGRPDSLNALNAETEKPWTQARIDKDFASLRTWSQSSGWPVVVNEFGVYRDFALQGDRVRWLAAVRRAAEINGFGWCHWEFDEGFGFTRSREDASLIDEDVMAALLGPDGARN